MIKLYQYSFKHSLDMTYEERQEMIRHARDELIQRAEVDFSPRKVTVHSGIFFENGTETLVCVVVTVEGD